MRSTSTSGPNFCDHLCDTVLATTPATDHVSGQLSLRTGVGYWSGFPALTFTYQWQADDVAIDGETGAALDLFGRSDLSEADIRSVIIAADGTTDVTATTQAVTMPMIVAELTNLFDGPLTAATDTTVVDNGDGSYTVRRNAGAGSGTTRATWQLPNSGFNSGGYEGVDLLVTGAMTAVGDEAGSNALARIASGSTSSGNNIINISTEALDGEQIYSLT